MMRSAKRSRCARPAAARAGTGHTARSPTSRACRSGRERRIGERRDGDLEHRRARELVVLRVIVGALDVVEDGATSSRPRSAGGASPANSGSRASARCSLAVTPCERSCETRRTKPASRCSPPRSFRNVVLGSALETTFARRDLLARSEPYARGAIVAHQDALDHGARCGPRRPRSTAARASASDNAPRPPTGCARLPAPCAAAARYSSVSTVPGERGP